MGKITEFKTILENELGLPVFFQNESFTTVEARRYNDIENADASAAALILQKYLISSIQNKKELPDRESNYQ